MFRQTSLGRRRRRGANAIEFALTLPMFAAITFGMMEYGWYFSQRAAVNGAIARACREASIVDPLNPPPSVGSCTGWNCLQTAYQQELNNALALAGLSCGGMCTGTVSGTAPEVVLECRAEVSYMPITNFLPISPGPIEVTTRSRAEWQREI